MNKNIGLMSSLAAMMSINTLSTPSIITNSEVSGLSNKKVKRTKGRRSRSLKTRRIEEKDNKC